MPQQAIAEVADLLVAPEDFRRWDGKTVRLFFPCLCDHRVALTLEGKGGRRSFAACQGSRLYKLGRQERLFLQAQRGEIGLDHHLDVGQTIVALQCPDQRAAVADGCRQIVLRHAGAFAQALQEIAEGRCRDTGAFIHQIGSLPISQVQGHIGLPSHSLTQHIVADKSEFHKSASESAIIVAFL